jgi:hypothetical protein
MASDRLASVPGRPEHDERLMNKNVIFAAADGVLCFGFSGLAKLGGSWTDDWLAGVLHGDDERLSNGGDLMIGMQRPELGVDEAVELVRTEAGAAVARESREARKYENAILWVGWRASGEPILGRMNRTPSESEFVLQPPPDKWWGKDEHLFATAPDFRSFFKSEYPLVEEALAAGEVSTDNLSLALAETVRVAAGSYPEAIGRDVMVASMFPPDTGLVEVRFHPDAEVVSKLHLGDKSVDVTTAFTPWYVMDGVVARPRALGGVGGETLRSRSPWAIYTYPAGDEATETHGYSFMTSVRRRGDPPRHHRG